MVAAASRARSSPSASEPIPSDEVFRNARRLFSELDCDMAGAVRRSVRRRRDAALDYSEKPPDPVNKVAPRIAKFLITGMPIRRKEVCRAETLSVEYREMRRIHCHPPILRCLAGCVCTNPA